MHIETDVNYMFNFERIYQVSCFLLHVRFVVIIEKWSEKLLSGNLQNI